MPIHPRRSLRRPVCLLLSISALAIVHTASAQTPVHGGTLFAVVQPEPTMLMTAVANQFPNGVVSVNIFDGLVSYDDHFKPHPDLAESWLVAPDGRTITFHLRHGVKWHDGVDFTSADVRYSVLEVWKKVHSRGRVTFGEVTDVETPDKYTAIFKLSHASPVIFSALNAMEAQVLPAHIYQGTDVATNPHDIAPIGTGPFRFKSWKKGQYVELERNPDYWDKGKPYLDRLIFRVIPDAATRAAALETGEVVYAPFDAVSLADVDRLRKVPSLVVDTRGYDWQSQYYMIEFNLRNPILKQLKVRQAIAYAINRQGLIDAAWYGLGKPATGPVPSTITTFYNPNVPHYDYAPAKAEQLLDQAGLPRKADGVRFTLNEDYMPFNDAFPNSAEYIRQNLKRVGITVNVRNQDLATYVRRVYGSYDFDLNTGQFSAFSDPQMGVFRQFWSKSSKAGIPWTNASGYASPQMDAAIEGAQNEPDAAKRHALIDTVQVLAQTDLPVLPLFEMKHFTVYNKRVHGLSDAVDGALTSLKDVWLTK
ncbi:MAG: ABC transporter substrate-binding protein [Janthinobacterium lividum]